ncbi:hypothetical protein EP232_02300 [bacterium]|nr:MAG: hypothetical protein EP232_02300 [bacterium]
MKVAAVDVGTNTIRCLIAAYSEGCLYPMEIRRGIVRLGGGLRKSGNLSMRGATGALELFSGFSEVIFESGVSRAWAVGTSAVRDSLAPDQFLDAAFKSLGFPLDVVTGEEEARLTAEGVQGGVGPIREGVIVDIGGGSTEVVRMAEGKIVWQKSLPEGVVHLTEQYIESDPPGSEEIRGVRKRIRELVEPLEPCGGIIAGTAGTPTTLAALDLNIDEYDSTLINGHVLSTSRIHELLETLLSMTSKKRLELTGMERGREDLIVTGTIMLEEFLEHWGFSELLVSDWGLLEGIAIAAARDGRGYDLKK